MRSPVVGVRRTLYGSVDFARYVSRIGALFCQQSLEKVSRDRPMAMNGILLLFIDH